MSNSLGNGPVPPNVSRGSVILGTSWGTLVPTVIVVILRIYARFDSNALGFDDACIVVSAAISFFGGVCNILQVHNGFGRHAIYLNPVEAINLQHWSLAAELQAGIGIGVTKVSICWFILRILKQTRRNVRILIWIDIAFVVATTAAYAFSQGLACIPLESYWNPTIHGKCLTKNSLNVVALVNNIVDVITDFVCAALPIFVIKQLQMNFKTKIAFGLVMGLGFLTAATSIGKAATVQFNLEDPSWDLVNESIWVILEENVAILVASLPGLRQLFGIFQRRTETRRSRQRTYDSNNIDYSYSQSTALGRPPRGIERLNSQSDSADDIELIQATPDAIVRKTDVEVRKGSAHDTVNTPRWT